MDSMIKNNLAKNTDELISYLEIKAANHKHYKHYSSMKNAENILNSKKIFLSNGEKWNDPIDRDNLNNDEYDKKNYGMSFSFSVSENVAMWMLYGRNDGCMIDFDSKTIKAICNTQIIELGEYKDGEFIQKLLLTKENFEISLFDVIYYDDRDNNGINTLYVKRSNEINKEYPISIIERLRFHKKLLPWSYENECRIVVSVNKQLLKYDKLNSVAIQIPDECIENLKARTYNSPSMPIVRYNESYLMGKINWNI